MNSNEEIAELARKYLKNYDDMNPLEQKSLINDVIESKEIYGFLDYDEYFKFRFYEKNYELRKTFFGLKEYKALVSTSHNDVADRRKELNNKFNIYCYLKEFYKRDVIKIESFDDYTDFVNFCQRNPEFFIKEVYGSLGSNISKVKVNTNSIKNEFFLALQRGECICEGIIKQADVMAQFNPDSVNTIRIATFFDDGVVNKLYGMFRTGRCGNIVDNASKGGIAAGIDLNNGIVFSNGYTINDEEYERHPDTNVRFKGFKIPKWDEVFPLIEKMHKAYPGFKMIGWDLAFTDDGWVVVETNSRPNIYTIQIIYNRTYGHGLKDVIMQPLEKYKNQQ